MQNLLLKWLASPLRAMITSALFFGAFSSAQAQGNCIELFSLPNTIEIKNLDDLGAAMSNGMVLRPNQSDLFELYRIIYFGDPLSALGISSFSSMTTTLERYPEISKPHFRDFFISQSGSVYSTTTGLSKFISGQSRSAAQSRSNLFQIDANLGFWKILLDQKGKSEKEFKNQLDLLITPAMRAQLRGNELSVQNKSSLLFSALNSYREARLRAGQDVSLVSQALVDIIHSQAFVEEQITHLLKSYNGLEQIQGFEHVLSNRENVARYFGYSSFADLMNKLGVDSATGSYKNENFPEQLSRFREDVLLTKDARPSMADLRMRSLSLQEAPFRGCLGKDCSTREYFSKALDPNFNYFTLTNNQNHSDGQITIVLGTAKDAQNKSVKAAFVDKIQNVTVFQVDAFLEAIRQTVLERGYLLVIPAETITETGLSDSSNIIQHFYHHLLPEAGAALTGFEPHENNYSFKNAFSRSESRPNVFVVKPKDFTDEQITITAGEIPSTSLAPAQLTASQLINELIALRNSPREEDKIKFIDSKNVLLSLERQGVDPSIHTEALNRYIVDPHLSFAVRKRALFSLLESNDHPFNILYHVQQAGSFSAPEWRQILSEIKQWSGTNNVDRKLAHTRITMDFNKTAGSLPEVFYPLVDWSLVLAQSSNLKTLLLAISKNANLHGKMADSQGYGAIHTAAANKDFESLQYLTSLSTYNINLISGPRNNGPTAFAILLHQFPLQMDLIDMFMQNDRFDINTIYYNWGAHGSILMDMLRSRNLAGLEIVLSHPQIDPNLEVEGYSPILITIASHWGEALEKLLELPQISLNQTDLWKAFTLGTSGFDILKILMSNSRYDIDAPVNSQGQTLHDLAIENGRQDVLDYLQKRQER